MLLNNPGGLDGPFIFTSASSTVYALVLDIWGRLPNVPLEIAEWGLASKRKLHALESRSGKSGPLRYFQNNKTADREA